MKSRPVRSRRVDSLRTLFQAAVAAIREEPFRPGSQEVERANRLIRRLALKTFRERVPIEDRVVRPRHFIYYEILPERIVVQRILHDARDQRRIRLPRA